MPRRLDEISRLQFLLPVLALRDAARRFEALPIGLNPQHNVRLKSRMERIRRIQISSFVQGYTSRACVALFFTTSSYPLDPKTIGDIGQGGAAACTPCFLHRFEQKYRFANILSPLQKGLFGCVQLEPSERRD